MGRRLENHKLTPEQFQQQIERVVKRLDLEALNFTVDVAKNAEETFRKSFKYHRYYTANGAAWQSLSPNTIAKRTRRGTLDGGILREYHNLFKSIQISNEGLYGKTTEHVSRQRVFTDPDNFNAATNVHRGFVYAGVHNNPGPNDTYGNGFGGRVKPVKVIQRQFMGFSTYIDKHVEVNIDKFLLDGLFGNAATLTPNQY